MLQGIRCSNIGRHSPLLSEQHENLCRAYETIIRHCGEDSSRQGLLKTPGRAARAMLFFTKGYEDSLDGKLQPVLKRYEMFFFSYSVFSRL
ncbi:unnamed protein product [Gongylonema pulchrum]|uniref:GTP_cyclohydroI domain-containing protein n=1 Tax=Gongylonema pulchrum TaxID=637853 RepID=A0A183EXQ1_9BILA|nr:unnamed protein product [Gongylonema pulchrum]